MSHRPNRIVALLVMWLTWAVLPNVSHAQNLPPELLRKLKAATVFIHCETHSDMPQGSGCFIEPNLIVTTARVLRAANGLEPKSITVVIQSGQPDEKELSAELVAYNSTSNIAFLRIAGESRFTTRDFLTLGDSTDLRETQSIYLAGYPLGAALSDAKNPTVTVAPATISSFRRNKLGQVELIQIDGNLIPGNSGGPLVDAKGKVIGIAESMVLATQIGFAIPSASVQLDLDGRLAEMKVANAYRQGNKYAFEFEARVCDPKRNVKQVAVQYWIGKTGAARPRDPKLQFPIYGAPGDGPKKLVKLKPAAKDPTGQLWTAEVEDFEFQGPVELWTQAGYMGKPSRFTTVASVNQTSALFTARQGVKPAAAPEDQAPPAKNKPATDAPSAIGERSPAELVPLVTPYPEDSARRPIVEHDGVPWLVSPLIKQSMLNISQLASSPSGDAVYVVFDKSNVVHKYDPKDYSRPVATFTAGEGASSVWCDSKRVVVGCVQAGKVVFLSPDLTTVLKEISLPDLEPHTIVGRAPDNSVISVWRDTGKPDDHSSKRRVVLMDEFREPKIVGIGEVEHCCFCFDDQKLLMQQFRSSPTGAPHLFDIPTQTRKRISDLSTIPIKMHNEFFQVFGTFDGQHLVMSHASTATAMLGPMETSLVATNLRKVELTFEGATFAEDPVNQWLIAMKPQKTKDDKWLPAVTLVNRQTGKPVRGIVGTDFDFHPGIFRFPNSKPRFIYVPGYEQVLIAHDKNLLIMNCSLFEIEAPIDPTAAIGSTVADAMANTLRMTEKPASVDKAPSTAEIEKKKKEKEKNAQVLGSAFGAKLAARFRGAKPVPPIAPTATVVEGQPLTARRDKDKAGKPVTIAQSSMNKYILGAGRLLQVIPDPTGEKLFAIHEARASVSIFDTKTFASVGEIAVPQFPVSLGFNGASLVVACDESAVVVFIDTATGTVTKSVKVKETESQPKLVCGCAPDGSSITLWADDSIFLIHPDKPPMFLLRGKTNWCVFPGTARHVWLQGDFTHSPSGRLTLVDTTEHQQGMYLPPTTSNRNMFGRKKLDMHRDCGLSFLSHDRTRFFAPVMMDDYSDTTTEFHVRTLVLRPDLTEVITELPGAVIHESDATDSYISWHSLSLERYSGFEVLYLSRASGRIYRRIQVPSMPIDLEYCPGSAPLSYMLYVPGRELILAMDPKSKRPELYVVRCGPIADDAATAPDPSVRSKNAPPQLVYVGKPKTYKPEFTFPTKLKGPVKFRIKQGIPGITIDEATGELTLAPKASHLGKYEIQIVAEADGQTFPVLSWVLEVDLP